jgi:hypothetical protein
MSKLIKLSTTTDQDRKTNSFYCISDQDIIIEPNSKISLLNCQISSGILKDYVINGADVIDGELGEIWGNLNLENPVDAHTTRRLLLRNGNYNITELLAEIKRSILNSLVSCTAGGYATTTSATLPMPANSPDFELAVDVSLNTDNKIVIKYNSKPVLTTNDIVFSNLKPGVDFDAASGVVSWGGGGVITDEVAIDPTQSAGTSQQCTVVTQGTVAGKFAVGDVGTLVDYAGGTSPTPFTIQNIQPIATNLDSQIPLNIALADEATLTVYSGVQVDTRGFKRGDIVSIDDGASTVLVPSANLTTGRLFDVELLPINENTEIKTFNKIPLANPYYVFDDIALQQKVSPGNWTLTVKNPDEYPIISNYCYIETLTGRKVAAAQITAQVDSGVPDIDKLTLSVQVFDGFDEDDVMGRQILGGKLVIVSSLFSALAPNIIDLVDILPTNVYYWFIDSDTNFPIMRVLIDEFDISTGITNELRIEIDTTTPRFEVWNGQAKLINLQGLAYFLNTYGIDLSRYYIAPAYDFVSALQLDPITLPNWEDDDVVVLTENGEPLPNLPLKLNGAPQLVEINGEDYTQFQFKIDIADQDQEFTANQLLVNYFVEDAPEIPTFEIFLNSADKHIKFTFDAIDDETKIPLATRIWEGDGIEPTYRLTLTRQGPPPADFKLSNYSDFVKGDLSNKYGDKFGFALCDEIATPGPGRAVFLVSALPTLASGSDFGLMEIGSSTFANLDCSGAAVRVSIQNIKGQLGYVFYTNGTRKAFGAGSVISAAVNDRIVIQWNTCASHVTPLPGSGYRGDKLYSRKPASPAQALQYPAIYIEDVPAGSPSAATRELQRNNIVISVIRTTSLQWQYMGAPVDNVYGTVYPNSPFDNPYAARVKWNVLKSYSPYIRPGFNGQIRMLELTASPNYTVNGDGVKQAFDGTNYIYHPDLHAVDDSITGYTKYSDPAQAFKLTLVNPRIQKLLGFSEASYLSAGASGSITANKSYLEAYLPENILVILDSSPAVDTMDCGQTIGKRRNIICCAINTQSLTGDINIEPNNLYKIALGNKQPVNSRKFIVSFETFYGEQIILSNAKATVNLLIEPPN